MTNKKNLIKGLLSNEAIHYRYNHKMECIFIKDIAYIESDRVYANIIKIVDNVKNIKKICRTVKVLEEQLKGIGFIRCHRSYLVNIDKVEYFSSHTNFIYFSVCKVPISIRKAALIFRILLERGLKVIGKQNR